MPRPSNVSYEDVERICLSMLGRGETPAIMSIQAELKKVIGAPGGTAVVRRYFDKWKTDAAHLLGTRTKAGVREDVVRLADELIERAMEFAQSRAEEVLGVEREAMARERMEQAASVQAALAERDTMAMSLASTEGELKAAREAIQSAREQVASTQAQLSATDSANAALREETAGLKARIDALVVQMREDQRQFDQRLAQVNSHHEATIAREREILDGERKHLHAQTYQIREAAREQEKALREQAEMQKTLADQYRSQALAANQSAGRWQGVAETETARAAELAERLAKAELAIQEASRVRWQLEAALAETERARESAKTKADAAEKAVQARLTELEKRLATMDKEAEDDSSL